MSIAFHIKIDSRKHRKGHFFVFYLNYYCAPELIAQHLPKCVPYTNHPESLCITRLLDYTGTRLMDIFFLIIFFKIILRVFPIYCLF
jgi:hypothetical protein